MNRGRTFLRKMLFGINILAAACLIAAYGAGFVSPETAWIFAFFGLAYPLLLIINLMFVVFWLLFWKKQLFLSLACILLGWNNLQSLYPFRFTGPKPVAGQPIKVLTFNVHSLYGNKQEINVRGTRSKVTEFLTSRQADIICIQEFFAIGEDFTKTLSKFTESIRLDYYNFKNYQEFSNKQKINAIATFSRYPIVNTGHFKLPDHSLFAIFSDIIVNSDTVRIYNVHLESIRFGEEDYSFYSHLTEPAKETTPISVGSKRMFWKLRKAFMLRAVEVSALKKHIAACRYPVILAGDFNDTPSSYSYHQLTSGLDDSFKKAGNRLFEGTYAGRLPSFRIDYILFSERFAATDYRKFNLDLSDHYPVSATLLLKP
jgi:endonuclease/exonuclease/phosphatase family metal-dependent hydrolase